MCTVPLAKKGAFGSQSHQSPHHIILGTPTPKTNKSKRTMRLNFALLLATAIAGLVNGDGVNVYHGFLSNEEIEQLRVMSQNIQKDSPLSDVYSNEHNPTTNYAMSTMEPNVVSKLRRAFLGATDEEVCDESKPVVIKTMSSTTQEHFDQRVMEEGAPQVDGNVAFIFLNSNPNASFVHGKGGTEIPVTAGTLVTFPNEPHYTNIKSGIVQIAGAFTASAVNGGKLFDFAGAGSMSMEPPKESKSKKSKKSKNDVGRRQLDYSMSMEPSESKKGKKGKMKTEKGPVPPVRRDLNGYSMSMEPKEKSAGKKGKKSKLTKPLD